MNLVLDMVAIGFVFALSMVLAMEVLLERKRESDERAMRKLRPYSQFPFKAGQEVVVRIEDGRLTIEKTQT